jgi:hypothetical protein
VIYLTLWLLCFFGGGNDPCPTCKTKGGYWQYSIVYEVHEPEWRRCQRCAGTGWNKRAIK